MENLGCSSSCPTIYVKSTQRRLRMYNQFRFSKRGTTHTFKRSVGGPHHGLPIRASFCLGKASTVEAAEPPNQTLLLAKIVAENLLTTATRKNLQLRKISIRRRTTLSTLHRRCTIPKFRSEQKYLLSTIRVGGKTAN